MVKKGAFSPNPKKQFHLCPERERERERDAARAPAGSCALRVERGEREREREREGRRVIRVTPYGGREARKSGDRCNASVVWSCSGGRAEDRACTMEPASHHTACANSANRSGILLFCLSFFLLSLFEKFPVPAVASFWVQRWWMCRSFSRFLCSVS